METKPELRPPSLIIIPADWTAQKDQEWYRQHFGLDEGDPYSQALKRLWHERARLEEALTEWIGIFLAEAEFDPDPVTECLGANAKADLLLGILQGQSNETGPGTRFHRDIEQVKAVFESCDRVAARYLLQRDKVWLLELGTVAEELARAAWQRKDSVRGGHQYTRRSGEQRSQP